MGNQLLKNYEIQKEPYLEAGFRSYWKIHQSLNLTISPSPNFSSFIFKKSFLKGKKIPNPIKEEILAFLKKEPQILAKFKHPFIVNISEILVEHKKCLVFATEKVLFSLQNLLISKKTEEIYRSEIEFKLHLLEICESLLFLHKKQMIHMNICPENIYITEENKWKLAGFNFTISANEIPDQIFKENPVKHFDFTPNPSFAAPELYENKGKLGVFCDIFAFAMTILTILKNLEENNEIFLCNISQKTREETVKFVKNLENLDFFKKLNPNLKILLLKMLNIDANLRPNIEEIKDSSWLNDPLVQTLTYLDSLPNRDFSQQIAFFKGFSKIITKFDKKLIKLRILPKILEFMPKDLFSSHILSIIFILLKDKEVFLTKEDFESIVWPSIRLLTTGKEISAQSLFLMVNNMEKLIEFLSGNEIQSFLLPIFMKCYGCGVGKLEESILKNTEFLVKKLEFSLIKNKILPKILNLCGNEKNETRKLAVFSLRKIYEIFDKNTVLEQILPSLEKALGKNCEKNVIFAVLEMYEGMAIIVGIEVLLGFLGGIYMGVFEGDYKEDCADADGRVGRENGREGRVWEKV